VDLLYNMLYYKLYDKSAANQDNVVCTPLLRYAVDFLVVYITLYNRCTENPQEVV